jgi:hypothetical protein
MARLVIGLLSVVALAFAVPAAANPPVEEPILASSPTSIPVAARR